MSPRLIVECIHSAGGTINYDGSHVCVRCPGSLRHDLRTEIAAHQQELIEFLQVDPYVAHLRHDPRAGDYPDDSPLWDMLLARADDHDAYDPTGLFGALRGLRCCGAHLERTLSGVQLTAVELGEEYTTLRDTHLVPHGMVLKRLLDELTRQEVER